MDFFSLSPVSFTLSDFFLKLLQDLNNIGQFYPSHLKLTVPFHYRIESMICRHAPTLLLWWHHSLPITITSTTSPLWSSTYCSVFGGSINSPFALRILIRRLLIWFPVLCAQGNGSWWCQVKIQRWYSGRGSSFTSQDNLALMMVGRGSRIPCIFLNAGITKRLQVTTADTGLPARKSYCCEITTSGYNN